MIDSFIILDENQKNLDQKARFKYKMRQCLFQISLIYKFDNFKYHENENEK